MKCEIVIDPNGEEKVIICAREESRLVREIRRLAEESDTAIVGYKDKEMVPLDVDDIYCVTVVQNKVYAVCESDRFLLKERLYTVEEKLSTSFIKINQSCIANIRKIERFDASVSGTLKVHFKNGYVDYVSRRQLKVLKERIGM